MDKRIQELHRKVGGEFDPFKLIKYMGIKIKYEKLGDVLGIYQAIQDNRFYINSAVSLEKQEDVCFTLANHYSKNRDVDLWITQETYGETMRDERIYAVIKRIIINSRFSILFGKTLNS
jgi:hypothetical protein